MNAREFLARATNINMLISALKEQKNQLSFIGSPNLEVEPQHNGTTSDRTGRLAEKLSELNRKIEEYEEQALAVKGEIIDVIMRLGSNSQRALLIERYINNKGWVEVSDTLGYSLEYTRRRLHPCAVKAVDELLRPAEL